MKPRHRTTPPVDRSSESSPENDPETLEPGRGRQAEKPREIPKQGWWDILCRTKNQLKKDNLSMIAAGVAFYVFLGIIPALAAVISIYGLVANPATIQQQVESMSGMLPPDVIQIADEQMTRIAAERKKAGWGAALGIALALWSGAKATKALIMALNIAYDEEETRGFFRLNLLALGLTLAGVIAVIIAVGLIVAIPILLNQVGLSGVAETLVSVIRWPLLALFAIAAITALYKWAPDRAPARWTWVTWGSVAATIVWLAVSAGFSYYVSSFGNYNKTYGSLGAVVVLMLWFLISAYVILIGAELNAEMEHQTARDTTTEPPEPRGQRNAYVADHIGKAHQKN